MMHSKRSHEGFLMIDDRCSGAGLQECATITCAHCHSIVVLNPQRTRERGYCRRCDHYVCDNPACNVDCLPFKQVLDTLQKKAYKQAGQILLPS